MLVNAFTASAQEEKRSLKLDVSYMQIDNQLHGVVVTAKSKRGKKFEPVNGTQVEFFLKEQTLDNSLGKATTNRKGLASIEIPSWIASKLDSMSPFKLVAFVAESKEYTEQSSEIEITKARIDLTLTEIDSTRKISAKVLAFREGKWVPARATEIKIFVRRVLSDLSLSENALTTNEAGEATTDFNPKSPIPGDSKGNIILGAKVDDNENYGTVESLKVVPWGIQQKMDLSFFERSLWAARDKTPIWLLVFPSVVIVAVWGLIFYMCYLIFKIREVGLEK
jgi:hypothetical protein